MKTWLNNKDVALVFECPCCGTAFTKSVASFQSTGVPVCLCRTRTGLAHVEVEIEVETKTGDGETAGKRPDTSRANYDFWKAECGTDLSYADWVAWRLAGNGED